MEPIISLRNISKTFGTDLFDYKNLVLKEVNLEIYRGQFLIIFGHSGSGKSSLLNVIAGLETPSIGEVIVGTRSLANYNYDELAAYHRLRMGMVFQQFNLIKSLNVWENVALPQTAQGARFFARKKRAFELLNMFGLKDFANRHPNELSGGQQQRVAIARSLMNNPEIILADEPTGNLDSASANDVIQILSHLHANEGHTVIMVTHNSDQLAYATDVVFMEDGKIIRSEHHDQVKTPDAKAV